MLDELQWPALEARRDQSSLLFFHKIHCEFMSSSSNGCHSGPKIFKPEKNLEFFRLKNFGSRVAILVGLSD